MERMEQVLADLLSRHIVEAHGGTLRVRSAVGAGASFVVKLPASGPPE